MSLKAKLLAGMAMALALALAAGVVLLINAGAVNRAMGDRKVSHQVSHDVFQLNLLVNDYLIGGEERVVAQWRNLQRVMMEELGSIVARTAEEEALKNHMLASAHGIEDAFPRLVEVHRRLMEGGGDDTLLQEQEQLLQGRLLVDSQSLVAGASRLDENALLRLTRSQRAAWIWELVFIALILGVSVGVSFLVIRSVLRPVSLLKKGTEALAEGDLDYRVGEVSKDELGQLARSFDGMASALKGTLFSLEEEVRERRKAEEELARQRDRLEEMVLERTAELAASEEKYRTIVENVPMSVFLKDRDSVYVSCNRRYAEELGISPQELAGKTDYDFFPPELADKYRADDGKVVETGETLEVEESYRAGGRDYVIQTIKAPARDEEGRVIGVFGVFWDISGRKRMEEDLRRSNAELKAFAHSLSHDLRSSLSTIDGFAVTAQEAGREGDRELEMECLQHVVEGARRVRGYVESLLDYAQADRPEETAEKTDPGNVLDEVLSEFAGSIEEHGVEISRETDFPPLLVSPVKLQQVLMNLVSNALRYMGDRPGARIEIGARKQDKEVTIYVSDNGVGIPPKYQREIFKPFKRFVVDGGHGLGIGLATVKRAVEAWGGKVWVESESGEGAIFFFTAPAAD